MELWFKIVPKTHRHLLFAHFAINLTCKRLLDPIQGLLFGTMCVPFRLEGMFNHTD